MKLQDVKDKHKTESNMSTTDGQQKWRRNHVTKIKQKYKSGSSTALGQIGIHWLPPLNADIEQPAHLAKSLLWSQIVVHTLTQLPYGDGFRWDRPADVFKRFGGQAPFNYVPDAMDQGACGSCWAFSVALVHTSRYRIWTQENVPVLSPSPILSCVATSSSNGCNGGQPSEAAQYCISTGIPSLECADYGWCSTKTNYCSDNPNAGAAFGQCSCNDADRPTCQAYKSAFTSGQCISCLCSSNSSEQSCTKTTCSSNTASGTTDSKLYAYTGANSTGNDVVLFDLPDTSATTLDYSDLQLRIMMEIFQHGPVQGNYFVMADFYLSTVSTDNDENANPQLWAATDGIYMNAPDMTNLYPPPPQKGFAGTCQMCPDSLTKGCNMSATQPSECLIGAHAVSIVGFGARKVKNMRGPLELMATLKKQGLPAKNDNVCYYWVCQNSWGTDWNANQPSLNADGLSNGKWFHAMSGTYEFKLPDGTTKQVSVNTAIGLDHTVKTLFGSNLGGSKSSVFGGVLAWTPADHMARWPFGRGQLSSYVDTNKDKLANSDKLVPCLQYTFSAPAKPDAVVKDCYMLPAKYCTTQAPTDFANCTDYSNNPVPRPQPGPAPPPAPDPEPGPTYEIGTTTKMPTWAIIVISVCGVFVFGLLIALGVVVAKQSPVGSMSHLYPPAALPRGPSSNGAFMDQQYPVYSPTQIVIQGSTLPPEIRKRLDPTAVTTETPASQKARRLENQKNLDELKDLIGQWKKTTSTEQ